MASEQLKNHLKHNCLGRKNAVKSQELEAALHISGNELRRQKKVPVCSGPEGYFYARNAGEIYTTIRSLKDMMYGLSQAVDGLEGALESFGEEAGGSP